MIHTLHPSFHPALWKNWSTERIINTACLRESSLTDISIENKGGNKQSVPFTSAVFTAVLRGAKEAAGATEPHSEVNGPLYFQDCEKVNRAFTKFCVWKTNS